MYHHIQFFFRWNLVNFLPDLHSLALHLQSSCITCESPHQDLPFVLILMDWENLVWNSEGRNIQIITKSFWTEFTEINIQEYGLLFKNS
jgi:hypothetical protein